MQWGEEASSAVNSKIHAEKQLTRRNASVSYFSVCGYWLKLTRERVPLAPPVSPAV